MQDTRLEGARTHNLKGVDLTLKPGELVALVGPSGAGKSSLAMATLYAEGQRRFVESFSAYARQFLERLPRPEVERLEPVPAAVAVDRQGSVRTSRSTVGSLTDVLDYAKNLWAHLAVLHCPTRGVPITADDAQSAADALLADHEGARVLVLCREPVSDAEQFVALRERLVEQGYRRVQLKGETVDLDGVRPSDVLGKGRKKVKALPVDPSPAPCVEQPQAVGLDVVVDRIVLRARDRVRLVEALEVAFTRGQGVATVELADSGERRELSTHLRCAQCRQRFSPPTPGLFSFNSAVGACETCRGFGRVMAIDWDKVLDVDKPLAKGGVAAWSGKSTAWERKQLQKLAPEAGVPLDVPVGQLDEAQRAWLLDGDGRGWRRGWGGLRAWFRWMEGRTYKMHVRVFLARYRKYDECADCQGTRFKPRARMGWVAGRDVAGFLALSAQEALGFVRALPVADDPSGELLVRECEGRLSLLCEVGLGYLSLDRAANTLSGGELQRVALASALGASLTGALFVLDEPTVGLHPRDVERLLGVIRRLSDAGNSVVVIEHDAQLIAQVDRVVELGPGAGDAGGEVVFDGTVAELRKARTRTAQALAVQGAASHGHSASDAAREWLELRGARGHNLQGVDLRVPRGALTCVTGVSGSGKSSLVSQTLVPAVQRALGQRDARPLPFDGLEGVGHLRTVVQVDQSPLVRTARGNPATYVGAWDVLRKRLTATPLAKERGLKPGVFSLNVQGGRCEVCKGQGYETVEMQFLADVTFSCAACGGRRFVGPVLDVTLRGHDVAALLELTVDAALELFADDAQVKKTLEPLFEVGLGYLRLGQPLNTLSGGEAQRVKLAEALGSVKSPSLLVLDEPTAGLHGSEVQPLLEVLRKLSARGDTVVVIEHDMRVAAAADHVVDLGPGAGKEGGTLVASGTPEQVGDETRSVTARYLARQLGQAEAPPAGPTKRKRSQAKAAAHPLQVRGASEHNLQHVDVDFPAGKLVVVTGPSGSGKSSLAFGVVCAEGQRRYMETLSPYARQYLPQLPRPAVDRVSGVPPTLSLEQRVSRAGANSTVATLTEVAHYLRLLYARLGRSTGGAASTADALHGPAELAAGLRKQYGRRARIAVYAPILQGRKGLHRDLLERARRDGFEEARIDGSDTRLKAGLSLERFKEHDVDLLVAKLKTGDDELEAALRQAAERAEGEVRVKVRGKWSLLSIESEARPRSASQLDPRLFSFNTRQGACPACEGRGAVVWTVGRGRAAREEMRPCGDCGGSRLSALARSILFRGQPISHWMAFDVQQAREAVAAVRLADGVEQSVGGALVGELQKRLEFLGRLGLDYLHLDRAADTLSGGEMQRVRLSAQLGSGLTGVLYVLDEPTIGLHPRDTGRLIAALEALVAQGNSALVVEHDTDVIEAADHVVDMGPGGGHHGGRVVGQGSPARLRRIKGSSTAEALRAPLALPAETRPLDGDTRWIELEGAREHNLRGVDVRVPAGRLTVVSGVSGSGKSTLVRQILLPAVREALGLATDPPGAHAKLRGVEAVARAVEVDQTPIGRTPRSVPATYVGVWDPIRKLLAGTPEARARGFSPSRFSFNVAEGRCAVCDGNGALNVEMSFLPDALVPCDACGGSRFSAQTLEAKLFDLDAGQILDLEISEAAERFASIPQVQRPLSLLADLGLGYLKLGQPSNTLSGGEAQRLKLVAELSTGASGPTLYVLDEPTTGLHRSDVGRLLGLLNGFVERGDTLVVIEHHPDVLVAADWLVDLGPDGGRHGGQVVDQGRPADVAERRAGHTGDVLHSALVAIEKRAR